MAVVIFTYPRERLSGVNSSTIDALYNDDPTTVTYFKNLYKDMFTQSCDVQSIMPINEAWHSMSFGQLTLHGLAGQGGLDVYGVVHLTLADLAATTDDKGCEDATLAAYQKAGIANKHYDTVLYTAPTCDAGACSICTMNAKKCQTVCGLALGWPQSTDPVYLPGGVWIELADSYSLDTQTLLAHEIGHRWYDHSSTIEPDASGQYSAQEYGDTVSVMGSGVHYLVSNVHLLTAGFIPPTALMHVPVTALPAATGAAPTVPAGGALSSALLSQPGVFRLNNTHKAGSAAFVNSSVVGVVIDLPASSAWGSSPLPNAKYYSFVLQFFQELARDGWSSINQWRQNSTLFPSAGVWVHLAAGDWSPFDGTPQVSDDKMYAMFNDDSKDSIVVQDLISATWEQNAAHCTAELLVAPGQTLTTAWTHGYQLRVTLLAVDPKLDWAVVHVAQGAPPSRK